MFGSSASDLHPEQRRSPRFPFDSLVRVTASRLGEEAQVWGRSTDLCREGIGLTVTGELTPEELVAMQIPLPSTKPMNVRASVRYCTQARSGFVIESTDCRSGEHAQLPGRCDLRVCLVWIVFSVRWRCCLIHEHTRLSQSGLTMSQSQFAVLLCFWSIRCAR